MDVNEDDRLSNITLRHKLKKRNSAFITTFLLVSNKLRVWWNFISYAMKHLQTKPSSDQLLCS
jgi:hypothetical protein